MTGPAPLHIAEQGTGPDLVLIHGWGLHGGVWDSLVPQLTPRFRVLRPDLPGHGHSPLPARSTLTLDAMAQTLVGALASRLRGPALWLGWSLGGMLALRAAALAPAWVQRVMAVAASARFVAESSWPGTDAAVLAGFAEDLAHDYRATLSRFLALQVRGSAQEREVVRQLRESLFAHGEPQPDALRGGLDILGQADLRPRLAAIAQPVLLLGGTRDPLVPSAALAATARLLPDARVQLIAKAGHAPFLSHGREFLEAVMAFADAAR